MSTPLRDPAPGRPGFPRGLRALSLRHPHPLKLHIATLFTVLILFACGVIALSNYIQGRRIVLAAAEDLMGRIHDETGNEMKHLFAPVETLVGLISKTPITATPSFDERLKLLAPLADVLTRQDQIAAIHVGYQNGEFLLVRALRDALARSAFDAPERAAFLYQTIEHRGGLMRYRVVFLDAALAQVATSDRTDYGFDPRNRPWYTDAMKADRVVTTAPYVFFSTREPGVTIARRAEHRGAVVGADVTLSHISEKLRQLRPTPSSQLAMVNAADSRVMAFSEPARVAYATGEIVPTLAKIQDLSPVLAWMAADTERFVRPTPVENDGRKWLVKASHVAMGGDRTASFVIASPLDELLIGANAALERTLMLALAVIFACVPLTWWTSQRIARHLRALTTQAAAIRRFDFSDAPLPRTGISEVSDLGETMGDMRTTIRKLLDITTALVAERNLGRLLERVLEEAQDAAGGKGAIIYLADDDGRTLKPAAQAWQGGARDAALTDLTADDESNPMGWAARQTRSAVRVVSPIRLAEIGFPNERFGAEPVMLVTVPLRSRSGEAVGLLCIFLDRQAEKPSVERMALVEAFAGAGAAAIDNQRLLLRHKALLEAVITLVANAIDAKSPYTGGHCQRVPELTSMLARAACETRTGPLAAFAMDEDDWEALHIAAWLHDCGKVTTPEYVVDKATKLETLYDRIHEIRMRFEVLKRDARIECLEAIGAGGDARRRRAALDERLRTLDEEFAFVAACNQGGESLAPGTVERLRAIGARTWQRTLDNRLGLSHEELARMGRTPPQPLPATESLLADKPEHIVERGPQDVVADDNPWGFKLDVPKHLYNRGELYNLSVARGTLTREERYKINDHISQTIMMLTRLPFPKHLKSVPELAGGHHEKMDGGGYPKRLIGSEMSVQARIMAIADIFEALTATDRPYKKGKTLSEAIRIMSAMKQDRHIDPDLFDLFLTSGVYRAYAERYMEARYIDDVDIERYVARAQSEGGAATATHASA